MTPEADRHRKGPSGQNLDGPFRLGNAGETVQILRAGKMLPTVLSAKLIPD
jgi:hypothetical protein